MISRMCPFLAVLTLCTLTARTQPVTDAEATAAGHAIELATNSGNTYPIGHFIYPDSLLENIRQQSQVLKEPGNLESFKKSFVPIFFDGRFGRELMVSIRNGDYRLVREYDEKGTKHLVFRMFGDGGLNYHDFKLVRVGDSIRAGDLYTYSFDQWISGQIARLSDVVGNSNSPTDDIGAVQKMTAQLNRQDYSGVKQTYDKLEKKVQQNKFVQTIYIQACHHLDLALYEKELTAYSRNFPDATSCYLQLLDLYYSKKEYDLALVDIDKLDKAVGGDPFLDYYRGNVYTLMNRPADAIARYEKVYRYDPTLKANVLKLVSAYAAANEPDKAKKVIAAYMQTPGYHIGDLNTLYDDYPDLR